MEPVQQAQKALLLEQALAELLEQAVQLTCQVWLHLIVLYL